MYPRAIAVAPRAARVPPSSRTIFLRNSARPKMASSMFALFFLHVWLQNGDVPRSTHTLKAHCATPPSAIHIYGPSVTATSDGLAQ